MKPPICGPCQNEQGRWLDSKPSQMTPRFSFTFGSGAPYDASMAGVRDVNRDRYEKWRTLVRDQMALIASQCRAAGHVSPPAIAAVVQLDLFALVGGAE